MAIIRLLQSFEFLSYINVRVPTNVLVVLQKFDFNIFIIAPSIVGGFEIDEIRYQCNLSSKLLENDVKCLGVNSIGFNIVYILLFYLIKFILFAPLYFKGELSMLCFKLEYKKQNNFQEKYIFSPIRYLNSKFSTLFYFSLIKSMEIDVFFGSWVSLISLKYLDMWSVISNFILVFFIIHNIFYMICTIRILFEYSIPKMNGILSKNVIEKYETKNELLISIFKNQIKQDTKYGIIVLLAFSLRDLLLPLFLIFFTEFPIVQIISAFLLNLFILIIQIWTQPFPSLIENIVEISNVVVLSMLSIFFFMIYSFQNYLSDAQLNLYLGYPIIFMLIMITVLNLVVGSVVGVVKIIRGLKNLNKKRKNKNKIQNFKDNSKGLENKKGVLNED